MVLTSVGLPYGSRLATWDSAGTCVLFTIPDELADAIGHNVLQRRQAGAGVTVECLAVDQEDHVLHAGEQSWPAELITEAGPMVPSDDYRERLRLILVSAARRGESVIVAAGGLGEFAPPAARASVIQDEDGEWLTVVEAFPAITHEGWAMAEHDEHSSRMSAPASEPSLMGAAMLLIMAAMTFTSGPELVGLYFEPSPDGPWTD
jgi:hypothetical protein